MRVRDVRITTDMIRLGQLLKLAGLIDSTGEAKAFLAATPVTVNGEPEDRRGRQLLRATRCGRETRPCASWR